MTEQWRQIPGYPYDASDQGRIRNRRTFTGERPIPNRRIVRHLNGNHMDNRLCNLAWSTPAQNVRDTLSHTVPARTACHGAWLTLSAVSVRPTPWHSWRICTAGRSGRCGIS